MAQINADRLYDVAVIGGGPAGLTAAIYLARARYRVLVIEKERFGGQITITSDVVNYPGVAKASGAELTETMRRQAESFGAEFLLAEAESIAADGDIKTVNTSRGSISCFGVLLAAGAHPRMVGFEGEEEFKGHGVAYCATCDGEFFTGKDVFVVGGGFAAAEESVFLTKYARHVTILIRGDDFSCARSAADEARNHEKITVLTNTEVESVSGDTALRLLRYRNTKTGEVTEYRPQEGDTFGVFVFAGYEPATSLLSGIAELDERGYVVTDRNQKTSTDGIYAAGDVCVKNLRQVVTAVSDGAIAATELERYAAAMQQKTGLQPKPVQQQASAGNTSGGHVSEVSQQDRQAEGSLFSPDIISQLNSVFSKMERPLILRLYLDSRPVSQELKEYMEALSALTDKLSTEYAEGVTEESELPFVSVCTADGAKTGLAFHGVPGGHEFTSFVLGLYNAAGPGQTVDRESADEIFAISGPVNMKILVSLSCTMCPELVTAAQRIASMNSAVTAEVYDINHFPALKDKYSVMSVPCLVINDTQVSFGKKNIRQLLDIIRKG